MVTLSNLSPSKIYPSWDFWFETKPSGNPGGNPIFCSRSIKRIQSIRFPKNWHRIQLIIHLVTGWEFPKKSGPIFPALKTSVDRFEKWFDIGAEQNGRDVTGKVHTETG
jgi:hypothetical protein